MKPASFIYQQPESVEEVLDILNRNGDEAKVLAGGQSLVPLMNMRLVRPSLLVDINRIGELAHLDATADELRVGALVRWSDVLRSDAVRRGWPLLAVAIRHVGHLAIRNRGTLCGGAAHADPAAELPAVLVALDARLRLVSETGSREVAASDFFKGVFTTALKPSELLVEIVIPRPPEGSRHGFAEFARRPGDFALAGAVCLGPRLVAFGAGGRPAVLPQPDGADDAALRAAIAGLEIADDIHADAEWRRAAILETARRAHRAAA